MMYAYVGCRTTKERNARGEGLKTYAIEQSGEWRELQCLVTEPNPSYQTLDREGKFLYSDFVYSVYPTDYGSLFNARFWIGRNNSNLLLRLLLLNERRIMGLAEICYRQYACLDGILPELYWENRRS